MDQTLSQLYANRRQRFLARLTQSTGYGDGAMVVLMNAPELTLSRDTEVPYRPDSYFYYLTGFEEPQSALIFDDQGMTLFVRPRDRSKEIWTGPRHGVEGAVDLFGADHAHPIDQFETILAEKLKKASALYYGFGIYQAYDAVIHNLLSSERPDLRAGDRITSSIHNPYPLLDEMRLIKDTGEIERLRQAIAITSEAYRATLPALHPDMYEYEIEAMLHYEYRRRGARGPAYPSIIAGAERATVLHYHDNVAKIGAHELVLIDSGCEHAMYASDVTRTYPVSGRYTDEQRQVYEMVLRAQKSAIAMVRPGIRLFDLHDVVKESLSEDLLEAQLLSGSQQEAMESDAFRWYFPHRTSHWLGLDVHDAGGYYDDQQRSTMLEPGMVFSVEPGLYFASSDETVPQAYRGIGVRIEDEVLVTDDGYEVLSAAIPKEISDIESAMADGPSRS